jgi:phosphopantothenoylcysteine synthetase/decarboxylase
MSVPSALVTCGPAYEPLDGVRRITNHSTGELGAHLCDALAAAGFAVTCLRGDMATYPAPPSAKVLPFGTNASLQEILESIEPPQAVFHAAALCDFTFAGEAKGKIRSDTPELHLILHPAPKILPQLRPLFPEALIVGWKYEVEGTREDVLALGRHQITKGNTDACVVNGPAYGEGLGLLEADQLTHFSSRAEFCASLAQWAAARVADHHQPER